MSLEVTYRIAKDVDLPILLRFRDECGWGRVSLQKAWTDPDRIYCVFMARIDGEVEDVGMGCWYMNQPDDLELASRETGVIHLASLFISDKYQGRKIGTTAMDILERVAVLELGAKSVTLDTTAYATTWSEDRKWRYEDFSKPGKTVAWYNARGYTQFRDHRPLYLMPAIDDPNRRLTATFLHKSAERIRSEQKDDPVATEEQK